MGRNAELLDLVCGPAGPLPDTYQRYRLLSHLATGGQAEVYRAVRLSAGVSSAPLTVKVFRLDAQRTLADQLRSWDKGDAVLMDLNSRGVPAICRRADGFYGPPPYRAGGRPDGNPVPYQVLDYLEGINLREYIKHFGANGGGASGGRLDAAATLTTLARVLQALHQPPAPGASPVVHMDVKPSNVMVLPSGEVRLIDFTGARYALPDHITTIAYTAEAGGPEAFSGQVGTAYDVHGFGAVAYFMVTGAFPRSESPGARNPSPGGGEMPPWTVLRRHPVLDAQPALRDHLLAPLADRPEDRPGSDQLVGWVGRLGELVAGASVPDLGLGWGAGRSATTGTRATGHASVPMDGPTRIDRLEHELSALRAAMGERPSADATAPGRPAPAGSAAGWTLPPDGSANRVTPPERAASQSGSPSDPWAAGAAAPPRPRPSPSGTRVMGAVTDNPDATRVRDGVDHNRGVASVPRREPRRSDEPTPTDAAEPYQPEEPVGPPPGRTIDILRRGWELTLIGALFLLVCWGIWVFSNWSGSQADQIEILVVILAVAIGLFVLCRFIGRLVFARMNRVRRSARLSHLAVGIYLVGAGISLLDRVPWFVAFYDQIIQLF